MAAETLSEIEAKRVVASSLPPDHRAPPELRQDVLEVTGMVKHFGPVRANDGVTVSFRSGEIHALLGENGAGKSTLIKILAGIYHPDAGEMKINGAEVRIRNPDVSRSLGIAVVHQQSALVPRLSVLENLVLQQGGIGRIDRTLGARMLEICETLGFSLDIHAQVEDLTVGERQRAEIGRALMAGARFVILDEPTSVLAPAERNELFALLERLAADGSAVVIVTHRLEEALNHCHRITVMRHGKVVAADQAPSGLAEDDLVRMMVGELTIDHGTRQRDPARTDQPVLQITGVSGAPFNGRTLENINLHVDAGEILGIAGVEGNGQRELAAVLTGAWAPSEGVVALRGIPVQRLRQSERLRLVGDIPDDESLALSFELRVWENLGLTALAWWHRPTPGTRKRIRAAAAESVRRFDIRTPSIDALAGRLSGGNRRRLLLARELSKHPELLVAAYPTKGLDVRSIQQVKHWLLQLTERGTAVVYIASDLDELLEVSDRIAVLAAGRIVGVVPRNQATRDRLGKLMLTGRSGPQPGL